MCLVFDIHIDPDPSFFLFMPLQFAHGFSFLFRSLSLSFRDGTKLDVDEDALSSGDEGAHFPGVSRKSNHEHQSVIQSASLYE
jgi:hypothetical protein